MAGEVVRVEIYKIRKVPQNRSGDHRRVRFGQAERGSVCCWLSQRGSNWMQTQFAQ